MQYSRQKIIKSGEVKIVFYTNLDYCAGAEKLLDGSQWDFYIDP